jgi:hypothetical protein
MPLRKLFFTLFGLLSIAAFAIVLWAPLLSSIFPDLDLELLGGAAHVRLYAGGALVVLLVLRMLVQPPRKPSKRDIAWGEFARSVGGEVTLERRSIGPMGWTGGTTVRWTTKGVAVMLTACTDQDRNVDTHFMADVTLARPFQCHAVHESMLTKVLFSTQLWNVALRAVKERERRAAEGAGIAPGGASMTDRLAFLGEKEILVGDPKLDESYLIKTDTPDLAREFFVDAGVSCALHDLDAVCKGWQLSLMWRGAGQHQLTLVVPGAMIDPRALEMSRALVEASIRCLADRGMLASASSRAA